MRLPSLLACIAPATAAILALHAATTPESFHFVLLGDRTGEAQPGIYEQVWKAAASGHPLFALTAGDSIQGLDDATAESEWQQWQRATAPWRGIPFYLAPGNHDIWSAASESLYVKYAGHPVHYSFDQGPAHFTILDNSRSDQLAAGEMEFLEQDLKLHAAQPLKFIVFHRPSWLFNVLLGNADFPLHQLARRYGVQYVIAGHVHELLHFTLDGIEYLSLPSAGGHLRGTARYEEGWFFGYTDVDVRQGTVKFQVHALDSAVTGLDRWGPAGLLQPAAR